MVVGEPFVHELAFCITQPSTTRFYIVATAMELDFGETQLYIISDGDSAEVIPSSEYEVHQPPPESTPIPTPEPVIVSPECAGEE